MRTDDRKLRHLYGAGASFIGDAPKGACVFLERRMITFLKTSLLAITVEVPQRRNWKMPNATSARAAPHTLPRQYNNLLMNVDKAMKPEK
ncbi:hypothetical protein RRF57_005179 [Xylaria bambusicola]|uniref:Uncharacterized protein n=1 Tax=Xylaria bambusicola TaxID=326684 RepID=A0AAN7UXK3_9PEZI